MAASVRARTAGIDGVGGVGDAFGQAGAEIAALRVGEQILAPIEDQRLLPQVGRGSERPGDGLLAEFGVAGDLVVERPGETGLRHGGVAGDQGLELLPAGEMRARARASAGGAAAGAGRGADAR